MAGAGFSTTLGEAGLEPAGTSGARRLCRRSLANHPPTKSNTIQTARAAREAYSDFDLPGAAAAAAPDVDVTVVLAVSGWPHFRQNCESSGVSEPHFWQNIMPARLPKDRT